MPVNIAINGAHGRMGRLALQTLEQHPDFAVVAQGSQHDDLAQMITTSQAAIVVDFTRADCVFDNTKTIIKHNAHPVIGTSGLLPEQIEQLQAQCKAQQLGGVIAPNFSIAAVLMMQFAKHAANYLTNVEIIEMHHDKKQDAPSGTAVKTAELLQQALPNHRLPQTREVLPHARGATLGNIPIHAIRLPGLMAHQQIIFGSEGETFTLKHDTIDRQCFMPGLQLACSKVSTLNELVYGLEHIL